MSQSFETVLKILASPETGLKNLASIGSNDLFNFYRGADLRNIDLSGQDLTGLNFTSADLRGTILEDIIFEEGAFNGALIDEKYDAIQDKFDIFLEDIDINYTKFISILYVFRKNIIFQLIELTGLSYKRFSEAVGISTSTLRRIREAKPVSNDSMHSLLIFINEKFNKNSPHPVEADFLRQPILSCGYFDSYGRWISLRRTEFLLYRSKMEYLNEMRHGTGWRDTMDKAIWNNKPYTIDMFIDIYENYGYPPIFLDNYVAKVDGHLPAELILLR